MADTIVKFGEPKIEHVTLVLTETEARDLISLTGSIGGSLNTGYIINTDTLMVCRQSTCILKSMYSIYHSLYNKLGYKK